MNSLLARIFNMDRNTTHKSRAPKESVQYCNRCNIPLIINPHNSQFYCRRCVIESFRRDYDDDDMGFGAF